STDQMCAPMHREVEPPLPSCLSLRTRSEEPKALHQVPIDICEIIREVGDGRLFGRNLEGIHSIAVATNRKSTKARVDGLPLGIGAAFGCLVRWLPLRKRKRGCVELRKETASC